MFFGFPFFLILLEIAVYLSTDMILPALPFLTQDLAISPQKAQLTMTAWFLGSASLQLILGPLTDRFGRKSVLLFGSVLFTIVSFLLIFTSKFIFIIILRFLQGSCVCFIAVAGYATIHELYHGKEVIALLAVMSTVTILAPALGPLVGGIILSMSHWRVIFGLLSCIAFITTLGLLNSMNKIPQEHLKAHPDTPLLLKPIFLSYFSIIKTPLFLKYLGIYMASLVSFFIWIVQSPFIIITVYGYSPVFFGLAQSFVFFAFILGGQITKRLIQHSNPHAILYKGLGIATSAACAMLIVHFMAQKPPIIYLLITMFGVALGSAMLFGLLNRLAMEACPEHSMPRRMAVFSTGTGLTASLGSAWAGCMQNWGSQGLSYSVVFAVAITLWIYHQIPKNTLDDRCIPSTKS